MNLKNLLLAVLFWLHSHYNSAFFVSIYTFLLVLISFPAYTVYLPPPVLVPRYLLVCIVPLQSLLCSFCSCLPACQLIIIDCSPFLDYSVIIYWLPAWCGNLNFLSNKSNFNSTCSVPEPEHTFTRNVTSAWFCFEHSPSVMTPGISSILSEVNSFEC